MHILFLSHYFPPEVNAPATRTYQHCRRWVAAGQRVTVITCAPNCPNGVVYQGYRNAWQSEERMEGIRVLRVWTHLAANRGFFRRILNYLSYMVRATLCAAAVQEVDIIVATSPQFFCGWAGVLCRWMRRRPLVLEIRDIWPESIVAVGAMKRSLVIRMLEWLEGRMYAAADHIVTVGEGYRRQLRERQVPAEKISVIPNGVDVSRFAAPKQHETSRRRPGARDPFICSYVGTVGMAHGLDVVLEAAQRLKRAGRGDVHFWIVGDGADRPRLQNEAARRRLDNVVFTGLVPKDGVARILSRSDACLVHLRPCRLFGSVIPSKMFEIMAANVPIIMGVRGEARQIVLNARAGVAMTPGDADSLLECIEQIAADRAAFRGGRRWVAQHYDRDELAAKMLDVLRNQLGDRCGWAEPPKQARARRGVIADHRRKKAA